MAPIVVISMQVSASISMVATTYIIYTIVRMKLNNKLFLKLVLYIAICDFWSAAAVVVGGTRSESVACYIQGIMNNYFCLASILWTMVIGYEVDLLVWYNRVESDLRLFSIIYRWNLSQRQTMAMTMVHPDGVTSILNRVILYGYSHYGNL